MADLLARSVRGLRLLLNDPGAFIARVRQRVASSGKTHDARQTTYAEWLQVHLAARNNDRAPQSDATLSLMTTVYERTDAAYLKETAQSLLSQSHPFHEWLVLAHGPVPAAVDNLLSDLENDARIKIHRIPVNLGIAGGTRYCIERATGDYVVPVDADDLLTSDALARVAAAIHRLPGATYFYSDEDALMGGVPREPYWRPDWDPVLNWTSSYIWHLCVLHRATALALGVYTDRGSEFCHDWDTAFRFWNAGHTPVHIPEILYHWRQHEASTTNRPEAGEASGGSLASTRHLLERQVARLPHPERYGVEVFPIFRGATEWHIARRHVHAAAMDLIVLARTAEGGAAALHAILDGCDYPVASIVAVMQCAPQKDDQAAYASAAGPLADRLQFVHGDGSAALLDAARRTTADYVAVCSDAVAAVHPESWWEALKLFELCDDTVLVCGRTTDREGLVVQGPAVFGDDALPVFLDAGRAATDAGPYALLLKAHTVGMVHTDFFVAAGDFLRRASMPAAASLAAAGMWLGASAAASGRRVAYSPLTAAEVHTKVLGLTNTQQLDREERDAFLAAYRTALPTSRLSAQRYAQSPAPTR